MNTLCIGLTGGVASGKSFVARHFETLGTPVLDADQVAREVVEPGTPALADIRAEFGAESLLPDGSLDRRRMRARVFSDSAALKRLEAITHPAIRRHVQAWREAQTAAYCIYSAAILVESGMDSLVHRVLVVDVPVDTQLQRIVARDQHDEALARRMIAAQAPRQQRLAAAADILDNSAGNATIVPQINRLHRLYTGLANARK
ncbi:MAG: dephospho-CoA kinase [Sinobacteraceae bacterium]|nr:dephospho-CoA kinase [Nevskiaceae bacterium]